MIFAGAASVPFQYGGFVNEPNVNDDNRRLTFDGVPRTVDTLKSWSISLLPGKMGRSVYSSAMMQPSAHTSMGEL